MKKYKIVAMGGTFDILHKGHKTLLDNALSLSSFVIIGLTSDAMAKNKGKHLMNNYDIRYANLSLFLESKFPKTSYIINKLENDFGPAVLEKDVEALIVSDETSHQGTVLNELRRKRGLNPVEVITVPMVLASDGKRISTTRIKNSEIDVQGNIS